MTRTVGPKRPALRLAIGTVFVAAAILLFTSGASSGAKPGDRLWARLLEGSQGAGTPANALAVAPDGRRVYVGGGVEVSSGTPTQYQTAAYRADGTFLWAKTYMDEGLSDSMIRSVAVSPDGTRVFVTGESSADIATVAYRASDGMRLWARRYDGPANLYAAAFSIGASPDGTTVFVTGLRTSTATGYDFVTVAYDASTGARRWSRAYEGSGEDAFDVAYALDVSADGSFVAATGLSAHADGVAGDDELTYDVATVSYDADTGASNWVSRFNGAGDDRDYGRDVAISPDGATVFVVGQSGRDNAANYADYVTLAYDAQTGTQLWSKLYDGPANSQDAGEHIAVAPDGTAVAVTGNSIGTGGVYDMATATYNAETGALMWAKRYGGSGDDAAAGVDFRPDGSAVYVAGSVVEGGSYTDIVTLSYQTDSGSRRWRTIWDGCDYIDRAADLEVSPGGGRVFVTGARACSGKPSAWVTIAYGA